MSFGADLTNNMRDQIHPKIVDTVMTENLIIQLMLWERRSQFTSDTKRYVVKTSKMNNWWSFAWLDTFNRNIPQTTQKMTFSPRSYEQPVNFAWDELNVAMTKEAVIDLQVEKGEEALQEMSDWIGTLLYWDWTWNSNKDFLWLKAWCDDWTNVATYGGLSRAVYTTLQGNLDSSTNTITFAAIDAMLQDCESWNDKIDVIITTKAIWGYISDLFATPTANTTPTNAPNTLFPKQLWWLAWNQWYRVLYYKWIPIISDEHCPDNHIFFLNLKTWDFPVIPRMIWAAPIKIKSNVIEWQYDRNTEKSYWFFGTTLKLTSWNQYWFSSDLFLSWNLICKNPRRNWMMTSITS